MIQNEHLLKQPKVIARINKSWVQAIVDTGASVSIICETSLPENCYINPAGFQGILNGVASTVHVVGTARLNFEVTENVVLHHEFVVLEKRHVLPTNIIVGTDILSKLQAVIDFKSKRLLGEYRGNTFSMALFSGENRGNGMQPADMRLVHARRKSGALQPHGESCYTAATAAPNGVYGLHKATLKPGCYVAESIVEVKENKVNIRIINLSQKELVLDDNSIISSLYVINNDNLFCVNTSDDVDKAILVPIKISDVPSIVGKEGNEQILEILNRHRNVVSIDGEILGCAKLLQARIDTGSAPPVFTKQFPLPHSHRAALKNICEEMKAKNIIQNSKSAWNSPIFLIKKSSGEYRPIVDFRKINGVTAPDFFPIPRISEIFQNLSGKSLFSTIDLNSGYFQVNLHEKDRAKTAFTTEQGRYEFLKCPFGLRNAPNIFARLMQAAMSDLLGSHCLLYMDDIIIYGQTLQDHLQKLDSVLARLGEVGLTIKLKKCNFLQEKIKYLGNEVSKDGISIHSDHFLPIKACKAPNNRKEVQKFLGLVSYFRNFIPNFAQICEPITRLLKKEAKFNWGEEAQEAFARIKLEILSAGRLIYPDFSKPFIIQSDASGKNIGAGLYQSRDDVVYPIYFVSRCLSKTEMNYSTTKRELLAIHFALRKFRSIILGYETTVYTDHLPLVGMFKSGTPEGTLGRWVLEAQEYDIKVVYLPGKYNVLGDCLSRIKVESEVESQECLDFDTDFVGALAVKPKYDWSLDQLKSEQRLDEKLGRIISVLENKENAKKLNIKDLEEYIIYNNLLLKRCYFVRSGIEEIRLNLCVPMSMEQVVVNNIHTSLSCGHIGFERTLEKIKMRFYMDNIFTKVKNIVSACDDCKTFKGVKHTKAKLQKYPIPSKPWERVGMDFLGPLVQTSNNNRYILGFTDYLTRFVVLYALPDRVASTVAGALKRFISTYDVPQVLISDRAQEFVSSTLNDVCRASGINKTVVFPRSPFSNGLIERKNAEIAKLLKVFCGSEQYYNVIDNAVLEPEWDIFLPEVQAAINSSYNRSIGDTPHFALFHFDRRDVFTGSFEPPSGVFYNYDDYFAFCENRGKIIYKNIKDALSKSIDSYTEASNKSRQVRDLQINQRVFITRVPKPGEFKKFAPKFTGPGYIVEKFGKNKYKVRLASNNKDYDVHIDNILARDNTFGSAPRDLVPQKKNIAPKIVGTHPMKTRSRNA